MADTLKVARPVVKTRKLNGSEPTKEVVAMETEEVQEVKRHAFVPHPDYGLNYVNRKVHGVKDFDLLKFCLSNRYNLLLMGDTGAGKTMMPMAYAATYQIPYYSVPCDVSIDPTALFGKMMPGSRVGEFEWVDGPVTELVRHGGILNISEINMMPSKIAASLYPLLDHRRSLQLLGHRGEQVKAHRDLLIVADMNPNYRGTVDLNLALNNRFPVKVQWDYDEAVENSLVKSLALLDLVRRIRKETGIRTPVSTNAMLEFVNVTRALGIKFARNSLVNSFQPSERNAVDQMLDAASVNIAKEISSLRGEEVEDLDDDSWKQDKDYDPDDYEVEPV